MRKPNTWFTADTHFGHRRVIELCKRPFSDVVEMREELIRRWNERVGPEDEVWHLGDFAYRASDDEIEQTFARLNGEKHLVIGNHDHTTTKLLPWITRTHLTEISVDGQAVVLCHYPLLEWRHYHRGGLHLFGHVHGNNPGVGRSCDVGVDVWEFRPVSLPEIMKRIETQSVDRLQQLVNEMGPQERAAWAWQIETSSRLRARRDRAKERGE